jgi:hypothetical protein
MLGTSFDLPDPNTTPPPFKPTLVTIPKFCINAEPVGFVCVHPPPTATYTVSPAISPVVLTPFISPTAIPNPSSSSLRSCANIYVAGIDVGTPASAAITSALNPVTPTACTGVPLYNIPPDTFFTYS